jgi:hypothetical protein
MLERVRAMFEERDKALTERLDEMGKQAPALAGGIAKPAWVMTVWNGDKRADFGWTSLDSMEPIQLPTPGKEKQPPTPQNPYGPNGAYGPGGAPYPNQQPPAQYPHSHPDLPDNLPDGVISGDQPAVITNEGSIPD